MEKQQFRKLQTGDLIEWNSLVNITLNRLGVVVARSSRIVSRSSAKIPVRRQVKLYQVRVKWCDENALRNESVYAEDDGVIAQLELIAGAKK